MTRLAIMTLAALLTAGWIQDAAPLTAQFTTDDSQPLVGEPFVLTLSAELDSGTSLVSWPDFPTEWEAFEVRQAGELTITETGQATEYRQPLTVVFWEPGVYQTPDTAITYQYGGVADQFFVPTLQLIVASVLDADDLTLRPFKPPVDLPYIPPTLVIVGSGILLTLVWWGGQHWNQKRLSGTGATNIRSLDRAMLATLKRINRQAKTPTEVYAAVAECLRDYVTQQFDVAARELTTGELINHLQPRLSQPLMNRLSQLMAQADLVKFAKQEPDREDAQHYLEMAGHWIQMTSREQVRQNGHPGA